MSKLKKSLYFLIPLVLVLVIALAFVPRSFGVESENKIENEFNATSEFNGQIAYAAESTGASEADKSQKGGALYLDANTSYTMNGGTISGKLKTYGGAVYISNKATFTMNGGTITSCEAKYGGAIYVANGGTCRIVGGTIKGNKAEIAPAIYVEEGGTLEIGENAEITANAIEKWVNITISETKENVGKLNSGLELYTATFGMYPQTYVGDSMRQELENWFSSENPTLVKTYAIGNSTQWNAYEYKGDLYARGTETRYDSDSVFKDTTSPVTGRTSWFKVEPIKWYILNYEAWQSGQEEIELYSTEILVAKIPFNSSTSKGNNWATSDIRTWCNDKFLKEAFSLKEQSAIQTTTLKNNVTNVTNEYKKDPSTWTGEDTADKIYLKTYYELYDSNGLFTNNSNKRLCSGTDFAIGNNLACAFGTSNVTNYGVNGGYYWLRSAGSASSACIVFYNGNLLSDGNVGGAEGGVRPALHLSI